MSAFDREMEALVARFKVDGPMRISFGWDPIQMSIIAMMRTYDRDTGRDIVIRQHEHFNALHADLPLIEHARSLMFQMAKELYEHEVQEQFKQDGRRWLDAHERDGD